MNTIRVKTENLVTLVGGGHLAPHDLDFALSLAPELVAADGGAEAVVAQGKMPAAVIGDFDSLSDTTRALVPADRLHHIAEQESTDFDKALRSIAAPLVLAVGFLGKRVDHQLAVFNVLVRRADLPCILLGEDEVIFAARPNLSLSLEAGDVVSLFPMCPVTGRSTGLTWPIDGLEMRPDGRVGTSNRADGPITLEFDAPGMLVIVPRRALPAVITALVRQQGSWAQAAPHAPVSDWPVRP